MNKLSSIKGLWNPTYKVANLKPMDQNEHTMISLQVLLVVTETINNIFFLQNPPA